MIPFEEAVMPSLSVGDRVLDGERRGTLREIYRLTDWNGEPLGPPLAEVLFDGDKFPTRGVWVGRLRALGRAGTGEK